MQNNANTLFLGLCSSTSPKALYIVQLGFKSFCLSVYVTFLPATVAANTLKRIYAFINQQLYTQY